MLFPAMTCMGPTAFIVLHGKPITLDASLDIVLLFIFMNKPNLYTTVESELHFNHFFPERVCTKQTLRLTSLASTLNTKCQKKVYTK